MRASVTQSPVARVPLFCPYHILTSSVIYYWTDPRQYGVYLLSHNKKNTYKTNQKKQQNKKKLLDTYIDCLGIRKSLSTYGPKQVQF